MLASAMSAQIQWQHFQRGGSITCFNLATLKEVSSGDLCFMLIWCWILWREEKTEEREKPFSKFFSAPPVKNSANSFAFLLFFFRLLLDVVALFLLLFWAGFRLLLTPPMRLFLTLESPLLCFPVLVSASWFGVKALYNSETKSIFLFLCNQNTVNVCHQNVWFGKPNKIWFDYRTLGFWTFGPFSSSIVRFDILSAKLDCFINEMLIYKMV